MAVGSVCSASHRRPTRPGRSVSFSCHFRCLCLTQTRPARLRCATPGSFAKVQRYLDSLYPYLWLCEKVAGPVGTPGNDCPMVLSAANQALFLARDWRYSIESITYHREALVIRKKGEGRCAAPRRGADRGRAAAARRAGAGSRAAWGEGARAVAPGQGARRARGARICPVVGRVLMGGCARTAVQELGLPRAQAVPARRVRQVRT